jgi:hypothetical protein
MVHKLSIPFTHATPIRDFHPRKGSGCGSNPSNLREGLFYLSVFIFLLLLLLLLFFIFCKLRVFSLKRVNSKHFGSL